MCRTPGMVPNNNVIMITVPYYYVYISLWTAAQRVAYIINCVNGSPAESLLHKPTFYGPQQWQNFALVTMRIQWSCDSQTTRKLRHGHFQYIVPPTELSLRFCKSTAKYWSRCEKDPTRGFCCSWNISVGLEAKFNASFRTLSDDNISKFNP